MRRLLLITLGVLVWSLQVAETALADGWIIPEPPPPPCPGCPPPIPPHEIPYLAVKYHRVTVTIEDQVATTHIDQVFANTSQWSLEGTYLFPLPEEAAISSFEMWVGGEPISGRLYERDEARRIYEDIVRRRMDPALLEYIGRDLFQASIFPIAPHEERRIELSYSQVLSADQGLVRYVYPLSTERFSPQPLDEASVSVVLKSKVPIKSIYSPSHVIDIERQSAFEAHIGWEAHDALPSTDFVLYYTFSPHDVGLSLLSHKPDGEDGFFTLLIAPDVEVSADQVIAKDVLLVLDTSGSMQGEKIEQAQQALLYVLDNLNEGDRFNIVDFATGVRSFSQRVEPLSARDEARRYVQNLRAEGGTDINRALLETLSFVERERPTVVIFLTDGLPTQGVIDSTLILNNVRQAAPDNVRLFPFGVGDDVDTLLLDTLARELRGASAYVRPGEDVGEMVSAFYAKVSMPVLTDVRLWVQGVHVEDIYPYPLPDVFADGQLVIVGRYREGGPTVIELQGRVNGESRTFRYPQLAFARGEDADFVPRLWATRKVGHLLNEIRLHRESAELIEEVINLSIRYGIITPYTSFLIEEPETALSADGRETLRERQLEALATAQPAPVFGAEAVGKAQDQAALEQAELAPPPAALPAGSSSGAPAEAEVITVADKAFVLHEGVWTDTTFDIDKMEATSVTIGSNEFFDLLDRYPGAGRFFAIGERVIVILGGEAYQSQPGQPVEGAGATEEDGADPPTVEAEANTPAPAESEPPAPASPPNAEGPPGGLCAGLFGVLAVPFAALRRRGSSFGPVKS